MGKKEPDGGWGERVKGRDGEIQKKREVGSRWRESRREREAKVKPPHQICLTCGLRPVKTY